jgi:hypothetical protein
VGRGAIDRARLALAIVKERLQPYMHDVVDLRLELIGVDSVYAVGYSEAHSPPEVRARVAARTRTLATAVRVGREVEALYTNGPAGGGGATMSVKPVIAIDSAFVKREAITPALHWESV